MRHTHRVRSMSSSREESRDRWRSRLEEMLGGELERGVSEVLELCLEMMLESHAFPDDDDDLDDFERDDDDHTHSQHADHAGAPRGGAAWCAEASPTAAEADAPGAAPDAQLYDDGHNLAWRLQRALRSHRRETLDPGAPPRPSKQAPTQERLPTCLTTVTEVRLSQDVAQVDELESMPEALRASLEEAAGVADLDAGWETVHVEELVLRRTTVVHQSLAQRLPRAPSGGRLQRARRAPKRSRKRQASRRRQGRSTG